MLRIPLAVQPLERRFAFVRGLNRVESVDDILPGTQTSRMKCFTSHARPELALGLELGATCLSVIPDFEVVRPKMVYRRSSIS